MNKTLARPSAVAGTFYPSDPRELGGMVDKMLSDSGVEPASGCVRALVVPHAGLVYSGPTAACAFQRVSGRPVERVILLGCSHHFGFEGASIMAEGAFESPLGEFPIDDTFAAALVERVGTYDAAPHFPEHALEVELPFLSVAVGQVPIVPILFGSPFGPWHERFAATLAELTGENDLVIASSDLSHYLTEVQANLIDGHTIDSLLERDVSSFVQAVDSGRCSLCSLAAVATAMTYSLIKGADRWSLLDYRTSARASGDTSSVVGYAALSMESA